MKTYRFLLSLMVSGFIIFNLSPSALAYPYNIGTTIKMNDVYSAPITRAEFANVLVKTLGVEVSINQYTNCFSDMVGNAYEHDVCYLKAKGFIQSYPDGTFKPELHVSHAEAARLFQLIFLPNENSYNGPQLYNDVQVNSWFYVSVSVLAQHQIFDYQPGQNQNFYPANSLNKARAAWWANKVKTNILGM